MPLIPGYSRTSISERPTSARLRRVTRCTHAFIVLTNVIAVLHVGVATKRDSGKKLLSVSEMTAMKLGKVTKEVEAQQKLARLAQTTYDGTYLVCRWAANWVGATLADSSLTFMSPKIYLFYTIYVHMCTDICIKFVCIYTINMDICIKNTLHTHTHTNIHHRIQTHRWHRARAQS